jgi:hypothetical protein
VHVLADAEAPGEGFERGAPGAFPQHDEPGRPPLAQARKRPQQRGNVLLLRQPPRPQDQRRVAVVVAAVERPRQRRLAAGRCVWDDDGVGDDRDLLARKAGAGGEALGGVFRDSDEGIGEGVGPARQCHQRARLEALGAPHGLREYAVLGDDEPRGPARQEPGDDRRQARSARRGKEHVRLPFSQIPHERRQRKGHVRRLKVDHARRRRDLLQKWTALPCQEQVHGVAGLAEAARQVGEHVRDAAAGERRGEQRKA